MSDPSRPAEPVQPQPPRKDVLPRAPLRDLVEKGIFPADAATRDMPVNRAELADILVKALEHNTSLVSEFPFFRDVPLTHWAYVPIEVAREKRLITEADHHGFYDPGRPVTYGEVYGAISRAITGPVPSMDEAAHLLAPYPEREQLPPDAQLAIAKMLRTRLFWRDAPKGNPVALWHESVTPAGLAPLVSSLILLNKHRADLLPPETVAPVLPANLTLGVTPSSAIFESRMTVGETLYFTLVSAVEPLPKGTRLRGIVRDIQPSKIYRVELVEAATPEDVVYQTSTPLNITFPRQAKLAFIVPGEVFEAVTGVPEPLPENIPQPAPSSPSPVKPAP